MIHDTVIDTSVVFPHSRGPPYKKALRTLCGDILQKIIQNDGIYICLFFPFVHGLKRYLLIWIVGGHDSAEDAIACMELMMWKIKQDLKQLKWAGASAAKNLTGQRKKKQTSPLFFCFSQFFLILFPPHQWRLIKCRVYHYFIILQLVISTFMIYFLLLHTSLFKNQCASEIRAVLCSRVSFSPLFVSSNDLPSNRVEIGRCCLFFFLVNLLILQ